MAAQSRSVEAFACFKFAAIAIGVAVLLDGLDGRIARLTRTESIFGRELDSLADVISFGLAPAILAFAWGFAFVDASLAKSFGGPLRQAGYFFAFLYVLCGAVRLARFNTRGSPAATNSKRSNKRHFTGLPIPAAAGLIASFVYALDARPLAHPIHAIGWLILLLVLAMLMVSSLRYRTLKEANLLPRSPITVVLLASLIYLIWNYSRIALVSLAVAYASSGIIVWIGGLIRRRYPASPSEEGQVDPVA